MSFVGLHIHSDYSLLDGASQLPQLVEQAVKLGMPAIAVTDHGVMYGAIELIKICRNKGIKPIIGNEMYVINEDLNSNKKVRKYHQVVLAKNTQGYKNLVKLTTISHLKGMHGKGIFARPCINKDLLKQYHEGLMVTSACLGGEVPQAILQGRFDVARKVAKWYKEVFGEDYYLEIQDHGYQEDRIVNVELVNISRELGIKIVATNDSHFISCGDVEAHDALLCINTGQLISEEKRMRYSGTEYLKSAEEMALLFQDHLPHEVIEEAIATTLEVANKVKQYDILGEPRIPTFPVPADHTPDTYVEEIAWQGLLARLNAKSRQEIKPVYKDRLEYELKMIERMGFSTYFLVVWDYIKYARDNGIPVGPGRGSAAGSLVAYSMGITNIDPVHHGLLFERFLNPERKSMPDIDTDFCIAGRDQVIDYVTRRYGEDKVAQIITFNRMTSKAVLKDVARVLNIPYKKADEMAKLIPVSRGKPTKLKVMISDETPEPEFKKAYENDVIEITNDKNERVGSITVKQWLDMAIRIEGTNKTFGVHAAGVVISAQPLDEIVPLQRNNDGSVITQYSMEELESLGLLKMDFLGLKNLTIIQKTLDYIQKNQNRKLDPYDWPAEERRAQEILARNTINKLPPEVEKTYKVLEKGDLEGIFQLESSGMRQIVQELKPSCIEDISSILALYRPGPLDAGLIPLFINRKHGREEVKYDHLLLKPILQETYAVMVYQEQIMRIAQDLAGYSLGQADLLRRCLSGSTEIVDAATGRSVCLREIAEKSEYWLGRNVWSLNLTTQKITQQKITEIYRNGVRKVWEVTTRTHRKIKATADHLFYTVGGWKSLKGLGIGDRLGLAKMISIAHPINEMLAGEILDLPVEVGCQSRQKLMRNSTARNEQWTVIADSEVLWDEIVSIESVGWEEVFDLSISETHNFIANHFIVHNCMGKKKPEEMQKHRELFIDGSMKNGVPKKIAEQLFDQMVLFAEYCFNKSHSTAYAYVTYQTAYLKANYPVEYMAALITANSGDQDKVNKYIANCTSMGIEVEQPDINRSGVDFTPIEGKILFGLSAVKNLGEGAIASILEAREQQKESFISLADLCDRIDLHKVNSRALESLIKCGALDCISTNRNQLIHDLELVIKWAQARSKEREIGQGNLLDLLGGMTNGSNDSSGGFESAPKAPPVEDFPPQKKLQMEKELLGFYVSDHPLKTVRKAAYLLAPINLSELADQKQDSTISAIVMLTEVKPVITKKGDRMAIIQMEDLTSSAEGVVFPKCYDRIHLHLQTDSRLIIWGKVDRRDDKAQLIIEDAEPVEQVQMVMVELTLQQAGDSQEQYRLQSVLQEQIGDKEKAKVPVVAIVSSQYRRIFVRLGHQFRVQDCQSTVNALKSSNFRAYASSLTDS